jgi:hypothetical protein
VHLVFGLTDIGYVLLASSTVSTGATAAADLPGSERAQLSEAITSEFAALISDRRTCCTNAETCGPPAYKIRKASVVIYRLGQKFPGVDSLLLHRMVKTRVPAARPDTVCCVTCYHMFMASDRISQCAKVPPALEFELHPRPFQPLNSPERFQRAKLPIRSTVRNANAPHRYALNLLNSPYSKFIRAISPPAASRQAGAARHTSMPKWVNRLLGPGPVQIRPYGGCSKKWVAATFPIPPAIGPIKHYPPRTPWSECLAPFVYRLPPFDVQRLGPRRRCPDRV